MAGDIYPRFRATAVQAAPVFLDREATISRLADWVAKARDVGADLVVFGESFIPPQRPIDLIHRHERRGHAGRALEEPAAVEALLAAESIHHGEQGEPRPRAAAHSADRDKTRRWRRSASEWACGVAPVRTASTLQVLPRSVGYSWIDPRLKALPGAFATGGPDCR